MRNLDPSSLQSYDAELRFEIEHPSSAPDADSSVSYGLNLRTQEDGERKPSDDRAHPAAPDSVEKITLQKLREDLKNLPDDNGYDDFTDVPVEDFAAALLAGYGWEKGKGIGRAKEDVEIVQYLRKAGTEGIGFVPEFDDAKRKRGLSDPPLIAPKGPDGRSRHVVGIDEKLVPRQARGVFVGKVVRVIDGRHVGLKGKVVEKLGSDFESSMVTLMLLKSGEEVTVGLNQVAELGSVEEEKCLQKLKDLRIRGEEIDRRDSSSRGHRERRDDGKEDKKKDKGRKGESVRSNRDGGHMEGARGPVSWLTSHIRVRIISKEFKGGKLYLKKGEVMDVVGPRTCDISMDESKELIQGVDHDFLETAIPKRGGPVLVLYGKHKGVFGNLVESDKQRETGVVRDADTHELLNVRLEQIAEYNGDPSYLGY